MAPFDSLLPRGFLALVLFPLWASALAAQPHAPWCELRVVDRVTGEGVPLVELTSVNQVRFVTDNAGRVALNEPSWLDREIFLTVKSHGYELPADGFGFRGLRITPQAGQVIEIKVDRTMIAERLCRLTGEGRLRDSVLLGYDDQPGRQPEPGLVTGQDSVQAVRYRDQIYWFWGDTLRMSYPLGLFRVAGATSPIPSLDAPEPRQGIDYHYFVDDQGFARAMMPLAEQPTGVVWILSLFTLDDPTSQERLLAWYTHRTGLADEVGQGIALFDDEQQIFKPLVELPVNEPWRRPSGHPIRYEEAGKEWLLFGSPNPNVRVEATWEAVLDPSRYQALTCRRTDLKEGVERDSKQQVVWRWQSELPPVDSAQEAKWLAEGFMLKHELRFSPADVEQLEDRIQLHSGSVRWNSHRNRWVLIAGQVYGEPSFLGEVWYSEAEHPTGPFLKARRIVTHDQQTFYNVCHHDFLDREQGRYLYFEGTYTRDFSNNPDATERYNYNQILYRLDLDDSRLQSVQQR